MIRHKLCSNSTPHSDLDTALVFYIVNGNSTYSILSLAITLGVIPTVIISYSKGKSQVLWLLVVVVSILFYLFIRQNDIRKIGEEVFIKLLSELHQSEK